MGKFVQTQPHMNSSRDAVTKGGEAIQGYINRRLTSKCKEMVLFWHPVSKIPWLNAVSSSGDHISRIVLKICEGFKQDSEVILALESCLIVRGFRSSGYAVFPGGGRDNSATVYIYL